MQEHFKMLYISKMEDSNVFFFGKQKRYVYVLKYYSSNRIYTNILIL